MEASLKGQQGRGNALAPDRKRLLGGGLGALMIAAAPAMAIAQDTGDGLQLDEIVVTAQKRAERIQDVPISITALTGADLEKRGLVGMGDYLLAQPSVVIQDRGPARNQIVIRGISTVVGSENPTVAFYIDEVPVSSGLGINANGFPDLRTFDVGRVEVLRGPQGTLYGAGSMGGTVKVVPNRAKIGEWQVKAESSLSSTAGGGLGNEVAAAVNAPLGDTLAVRVAGYHYHEAGFIKDRFPGSPNPSAPVAALGGASWADVGVSSFGVPARSVDDVNAANVDGVRAGVTFQPTEKLEIVLTALAQRSKANGLPENMPTLGTYTQSRFLPEMLKDNYQLYDALINYDLGFGRLTSVTAYVNRSQVQYRDVSASFLGAPISLDDDNENKNFSQEIRFSSDALNPFGILIGGFYSRTTAHAIQDAAWHGTAQSLPEFTSVLLGSPVAAGSSLFHKNDRNVGEQLSGFGELSYRPIESLKLSAGLRVANYTLTTDAFQDGALNGNVVTSYSVRTEETVPTPSFQVEYKPEEGSLYYARAAKGFRLGGPNQPLPSTCAADLAAIGLTKAPSSVNSDSLWSYEAGVKQTLAGGSASLNASAFYIDWTDIQTGFLLPNCGFSFAGNAGDARSRGLEMDFSWRVTKSLTLNTSGSFTDATLQSDSPPSTGIGGKKGDRLPGIPRWSVQGGAQYDFPVVDKSAFARVDVRYISGYLNRFPGASTEAQPAGNFTVVDARVGMDVSSGLQAEIFATNIFNTKQLLEVDTELPDQRQILGRPRTVGITLRYDY